MMPRIDHIDRKNALRNFQHVSIRLGRPGPRSVAAFALLLSACAHAGTPAESAASIARECKGDSEQAMAEVLKSVEEAQPRYEKTTKPRPIDSFRLAGARLRVAAQRGMTPQWLERTIRCHQAKVALQPGLASASDPFCSMARPSKSRFGPMQRASSSCCGAPAARRTRSSRRARKHP
jgi:methylphosphotriester-DNA--protein-cysteine methyltransferase